MAPVRLCQVPSNSIAVCSLIELVAVYFSPKLISARAEPPSYLDFQFYLFDLERVVTGQEILLL